MDLFAGIPARKYTEATAWYKRPLSARIAQIAERGLEPAERETYANGVRKATFRDPDGNQIGFGGDPAGRKEVTANGVMDYAT
jgi:hypothetical protein